MEVLRTVNQVLISTNSERALTQVLPTLMEILRDIQVWARPSNIWPVSNTMRRQWSPNRKASTHQRPRIIWTSHEVCSRNTPTSPQTRSPGIKWLNYWTKHTAHWAEKGTTLRNKTSTYGWNCVTPTAMAMWKRRNTSTLWSGLSKGQGFKSMRDPSKRKAS